MLSAPQDGDSPLAAPSTKGCYQYLNRLSAKQRADSRLAPGQQIGTRPHRQAGLSDGDGHKQR